MSVECVFLVEDPKCASGVYSHSSKYLQGYISIGIVGSHQVVLCAHTPSQRVADALTTCRCSGAVTKFCALPLELDSGVASCALV